MLGKRGQEGRRVAKGEKCPEWDLNPHALSDNGFIDRLTVVEQTGA